MKLRNKKTGQIGNFVINKDHFECVDLDYVTEYTSLAELNEEWEDYEEPEGWWFIDRAYEPHATNSTLRNVIADQEIGNYFETKEEAEKAVEKLKAWKRLKDKGFRFDGWDENHHNLGIIEFSFSDVKKSVYDFENDLDTCFGGEE